MYLCQVASSFVVLRKNPSNVDSNPFFLVDHPPLVPPTCTHSDHTTYVLVTWSRLTISRYLCVYCFFCLKHQGACVCQMTQFQQHLCGGHRVSGSLLHSHVHILRFSVVLRFFAQICNSPQKTLRNPGPGSCILLSYASS